MDEAERCYQRMRSLQDGANSYPMRYFYDTGDVRRVGGFPWPGLRPLDWPDPHDILPTGVGTALLDAYPQIAAEAKAAVERGAIRRAGDAYPEIAVKRQVLNDFRNSRACLVLGQLPSWCRP
eukprot:SAG31_NODE_2640_length_5324_cov_5.437835_4_plen_122_part_00